MTNQAPLIFLLLLGGGGLIVQAASFWDEALIISQLKSLVQWIGGDSEGAKQTQINFSRGTYIPVVAVRSIVELFSGDSKAAAETWENSGSSLNSMVDSVPVVGHVKGGVHYAFGDTQGGHHAMKAASRTTGVAIGGALGMAGGPAGAVAGGLVGGVAADGIITGVESAIHDEFRPTGHIRNVAEIAEGNVELGHIFDTVAAVGGDAIGGYAMGKTGGVRPRVGKGRSGFQSPRRMSCFVNCNNNYKPISVSRPEVIPHNNPHTMGLSLPSPSGGTALGNSVGSSAVDRAVFGVIGSSAVGSAQSQGGSNPKKRPRDDENNNDDDKENEKPKDDEEENDEDKVKKCGSLPSIQNLDRAKMTNCENSYKAGQRCKLYCLRGYEPSKVEINCEKIDGQVKWNARDIRCLAEVVCRDHNNKPVDWYLMYRTPTERKEQMPSYIFITRETLGSTNNFYGILGPRELHNTLSVLRTKDNGITFVQYSDQPPDTSSKSGAHSKGVAAKRGNSGFYLYHTLPKFPPKIDSGSSSYASNNGQLFICISFNANQYWDNVVNHVKNLGSFEYDYSQNWVRTTRLRRPNENFRVNKIVSRGGQAFDLFSKFVNSQFRRQDIYRDIIAPYYQVGLDVLSWTNGEGTKMPSDCTTNFNINNVQSLRLNPDHIIGDERTSWDSTKEHGKWALSQLNGGRGTQVFCAADLNRMESQLGRRGGAVCFQSGRVYQTFRNMVVRTEDCPAG